MKVNNKYLNRPIIVQFLDHTNFDEIITCRAIGWLAAITDDSIKLVSWDLLNTSEEIRLNNMEFISIVTGAIKSIKVLK